jgi:hypothetical protein
VAAPPSTAQAMPRAEARTFTLTVYASKSPAKEKPLTEH